jgi:hypothetical protein
MSLIHVGLEMLMAIQQYGEMAVKGVALMVGLAPFPAYVIWRKCK